MSSPLPLPINQPGNPLGLYFKGCLAAAREKQNQYNEQFRNPETGKLELKECVRKNHIQLLEVLMRLMGKKMFVNRTTTGDGFPEIYVTRKGLSRSLQCSERTVYNLLNRLELAGFIKKDFRSSCFPMIITINEEVLTAKVRFGEDELEKEAQGIELTEAEKGLTTLLMRQTLPNKIHSLNSKNTLLRNDVETVENPSGLSKVSGEVDGFETLETGNTGSKQVSGETPPVAAPPRDEEFVKEVNKMVNQLWLYAYSRCYSRSYKFIASSEILNAQLYFAQALMMSTTIEAAQARFDRLITRLELVGQFLDRKPGRYVPIPSVYFDVNNPHGFLTTREWLKDMSKKSDALDEAKRRNSMYQHINQTVIMAYENADFHSIKSYKFHLEKLSALNLPTLVDQWLSYQIKDIQSNN
jgi:hypothetical protein